MSKSPARYKQNSSSLLTNSLVNSKNNEIYTAAERVTNYLFKHPWLKLFTGKPSSFVAASNVDAKKHPNPDYKLETTSKVEGQNFTGEEIRLIASKIRFPDTKVIKDGDEAEQEKAKKEMYVNFLEAVDELAGQDPILRQRVLTFVEGEENFYRLLHSETALIDGGYIPDPEINLIHINKAFDRASIQRALLTQHEAIVKTTARLYPSDKAKKKTKLLLDKFDKSKVKIVNPSKLSVKKFEEYKGIFRDVLEKTLLESSAYRKSLAEYMRYPKAQIGLKNTYDDNSAKFYERISFYYDSANGTIYLNSADPVKMENALKGVLEMVRLSSAKRLLDADKSFRNYVEKRITKKDWSLSEHNYPFGEKELNEFLEPCFVKIGKLNGLAHKKVTERSTADNSNLYNLYQYIKAHDLDCYSDHVTEEEKKVEDGAMRLLRLLSKLFDSIPIRHTPNNPRDYQVLQLLSLLEMGNGAGTFVTTICPEVLELKSIIDQRNKEIVGFHKKFKNRKYIKETDALTSEKIDAIFEKVLGISVKGFMEQRLVFSDKEPADRVNDRREIFLEVIAEILQNEPDMTAIFKQFLEDDHHKFYLQVLPWSPHINRRGFEEEFYDNETGYIHINSLNKQKCFVLLRRMLTEYGVRAPMKFIKDNAADVFELAGHVSDGRKEASDIIVDYLIHSAKHKETFSLMSDRELQELRAIHQRVSARIDNIFDQLQNNTLSKENEKLCKKLASHAQIVQCRSVEKISVIKKIAPNIREFEIGAILANGAYKIVGKTDTHILTQPIMGKQVENWDLGIMCMLGECKRVLAMPQTEVSQKINPSAYFVRLAVVAQQFGHNVAQELMPELVDFIDKINKKMDTLKSAIEEFQKLQENTEIMSEMTVDGVTLAFGVNDTDVVNQPYQ